MKMVSEEAIVLADKEPIMTLREVHLRYIVWAAKKNPNKKQLAHTLGISRQTIYDRLKEAETLGIK